MATADGINKALATNGGALAPADRIESLLERVDVKKRIEDMLGNRAAAFASSVIAAYKGNKQLQLCPPMSVVASAIMAATLDLPINPSLGFSAIVPYMEFGKPVAQFQIMWRGFVQLGIRTGQYKTMNTCEVYADEIEHWDPIRGEIKLRPTDDWKMREDGSGEVVGYVAFFRTVTGFEKYLYMTKQQVERHAKKFSKSYQKGKGKWMDDFDAMARKTVIKLLLSKFGPLSIDTQMQKALAVDQAEVTPDGEVKNYPDAIEAEPVGDAIEPTDQKP